MATGARGRRARAVNAMSSTESPAAPQTRAHNPQQAALARIARRLERVIVEPGTVRSPLDSLARPVLRSLGWKPKFVVSEIGRLLDLLSTPTPAPTVDVRAQLERAIGELEINARAAERCCIVYGRVPPGHEAWLERLFDVVAGAARLLRPADAVETADRGAKPARERRDQLSSQARRDFAATSRVRILAPLERSAPASLPARLESVQLSAIDHLLEAARSETELLAHRRRLLEGARALLLETSAALALDGKGTQERLRHIASEIVRIDRLEAAGIRPDVGVLHQARAALASRDRERLYAALVALDGAALETGDAHAHALLEAGLSRLERSARRGRRAEGSPDRDANASLEQSFKQVLGHEVLAEIRRARERGRAELTETPVPTDPQLAAMHRLALEFMQPGHDEAILPLTVATDGCFDVGGTLSPVRALEYATRARAVSYPTQELLLLPAKSVEDVPHAVIEDPRTILLSLAAGRLLTRRYVKAERIVRERVVLRGEARIYVLDGSTSMMEADPMAARARMRDAILVSELSTLMRRYDEAHVPVRVVLYYRYFTKVVGPIRRVSSSREALAAIGEVTSTVRNGGTDIELALSTSFAQIRDAKQADPELARAQIVLVTDGEAEVREEIVEKGMRELGSLSIRLSVIALGLENPALRAIVAKQRARGERAFYHFVPDAELVRLASGDLGRTRALHLDARGRSRIRRGSSNEARRDLELEVLLDDLAALRRAQERGGAAMRAALEEAALDEAALGHASAQRLSALRGPEAAAARREALERDRAALQRRFDRAFPKPCSEAQGANSIADRDDVDAAIVALTTISETLSITEGSEITRRADAIDLLERLLPDAGMSFARYGELSARASGPLAQAIVAVRLAAGASG